MAPEKRIKEFCDELKAAREYQNLELGRIAERSKISVQYLEKLEEGDWEFLPTPYIRSFLRTYARILSMDVEEVLNQYDTITGIPPVPVDLTGGQYDRVEKKRKKLPPPKIPSGELVEDEPGSNVNLGETFGNLAKPPAVYWLVGVVIVVAVLAVIFFMPRSEPVENEFRVEDLDTPAEQVTGDSLAQGNEATPAIEPATKQEQAQPQPAPNQRPRSIAGSGRLSLTVTAKSECWFQVIMDKKEASPKEALLQPGETAVYRADSLFNMVVGNGGGITLQLDGRELGTPGIEGRRTSLAIDRNGIRP